MHEQGTIGWAIWHITETVPGRAQRAGWNGKGMWIDYVPGTDDLQGYVRFHPASGGPIPWVCSQSDLLADDWQECK